MIFHFSSKAISSSFIGSCYRLASKSQRFQKMRFPLAGVKKLSYFCGVKHQGRPLEVSNPQDAHL